jgi:hypothetical protein
MPIFQAEFQFEVLKRLDAKESLQMAGFTYHVQG